MTREELIAGIRRKRSFLCVGLDPDPARIPAHLVANSADPVFEFNRQIIDATADFAVAYKPNLAFYEALGSKGWDSLEKTLAHIPSGIFTIADAKRGDIGNTSGLYAKAFFETLSFDAVTVAPYMGADSIRPFLCYNGKWVIVLALTSNQGASDFQYLPVGEEGVLFQEVIRKVQSWGNPSNIMFVVGATRADQLAEVRKIIPDHFLLVPGVGAQGGNLEEVAANGMTKDIGLLVNSSRAILYASEGADFAEKAGQEARKMAEAMAVLIEKYGSYT